MAVEERQRGKAPRVIVGALAEVRGDPAHPFEEDRKVLLDVSALDARAKSVPADLGLGVKSFPGNACQGVANLFVRPLQNEDAAAGAGSGNP